MLYFLITLSFAENECAIEEYHRTITKVTGDSAAESFLELSRCAPEIAKQFIKTTVPTFITTEIGYKAAVEAVKLGGQEDVLSWVKTIEPHEQKAVLRALGDACQNDISIQNLFTSVAADDPDRFWGKRYYQYVTDCRVESINTILKTKYDEGVAQGRSQYFAVASAMARNYEGESIPILTETIANSDDGELQSNLIASIFEAVDETVENHPDEAVTIRDVNLAAIASIRGNAENYSLEGIAQARTSLTALGAEAESDELAQYYYKQHQQPDGNFTWGLVIVENAVCQKNKLKQTIHVSSISETGTNWSDQMHDRVQEPAQYQWELDLSKRCKGTGEVLYIVSDTPINNQEQLSVWQEEIITKRKDPEIKKVVMLRHPALSL
jgi:hypothetical protein